MKSRQFFLNQIDLLQSFIKQHFRLSVKIGAELEFYLPKNADWIASSLAQQGWVLEKERGWQQYECIFGHEHRAAELIEQIITMKGQAQSLAQQSNCTAMFEAKPYTDDYGSALHLHISLHDNDGGNVFAATEVKEAENIGKVIAGLLDISSESVYLLCRSPQDYLRFTPKFLSPTHISWGANNRTTLLRIPTSAPKYKRVEFRLPPSSTEPVIAVYVALIGIIHGLSNDLTLPPQIYGNAFDDMYKLTELPKSFSDAKNIFEKNGKILHYTKEIAPKLILDNYL